MNGSATLLDCVDFSYVCLCSRGPGPADLSVLLLWGPGLLPSGIGSKAIFGVGDRPGGLSCAIRKRKTVFVFPSGP